MSIYDKLVRCFYIIWFIAGCVSLVVLLSVAVTILMMVTEGV